MTAPVLGVDPGTSGAAVLLAGDGRRVLGVWSWRQLDRKDGPAYPFEGSDGTATLWVTCLPSIHEIAHGITAGMSGIRSAVPDAIAYDLSAPWYRLAVEGLFVWPGRTNGIIELAEAVGELMGPLRARASRVERCAPSMWRSAVLPRGWGRSSEEAERAALTVARTMRWPDSRWTEALPGTPDPAHPHVVEAACIARWGWAQQQMPAQPALLASKRRR